MDFSALVLMEKDKETGFLIKEMGSYEVNEGAEYVTKLFYDGDVVYLSFDTGRDVEDWEFSAVFDMFDEECFKNSVLTIAPKDDEYNPTWIVTFNYDEDHELFKEKLDDVCALISQSINKVFNDISGKKEDYI